jgi:Tfp pilus assembly protein PilO
MQRYLARLNLRQLWLLGSGVLLLLVALLSTRAVRPALKAYRSAQSAVSAVSAQANGAGLDPQLAQESEQVAELGRRLHDEMADVPARELEAVVVGRLQNVSWRHGVELASVRPGRGEGVQSFEELLFDVEVNGRYADLYAWLEDLHQELAFVAIKSIVIQRSGDDGDGATPKLRATLTLASYRALGS